MIIAVKWLFPDNVAYTYVKLNIITKIFYARDDYDHLSALEMELLQSYSGYNPEKGAKSHQYQ